ncbi:Cytochrome c [Reichenbachiella faecimaris]|uniref:Cytochrome c n=1 Tax=Reichenbachiella faecimaris TaxID=692418 RepID=A0A1W2G6Y2_REIFA|nr:cytochrome c [Reichenbachiella faecimaris]SMD32108.1 Cytochrome c [Reichenbachiella faecimaris]
MSIFNHSIPLVILCLIIFSCRSDNRYSGSEAIKFDQYMFQGEQLYAARCLNCHQNDGTGLGKLIPPLTTDFITKQKDLAICGIKHGLEGPMEINGTAYDGIMPNNPRLTPLEIAEIMTYISNSWDNDYGMVNINEVKTALEKCLD